MNRRKHPERAYRRKPTTGDTTRNRTAYRVEASWNHSPDHTIVKVTPDKKAARRLAQERAEQGAYVILQQRDNFQWRTLAEYDGPAMAAERREHAAEQARAVARAEAERRQAATDQATSARRAARREATLDRLARVMVMPPVPRDATGRTTARHTTGR